MKYIPLEWYLTPTSPLVMMIYVKLIWMHSSIRIIYVPVFRVSSKYNRLLRSHIRSSLALNLPTLHSQYYGHIMLITWRRKDPGHLELWFFLCWAELIRSPYVRGFSLQGLYSLSGDTSYGKISWIIEAARVGFRLFQSLWNLTGTSTAALPRCLSNFRALRLL